MHNINKVMIHVLIVVAALALWPATRTRAQSGATTASLAGFVADEQGNGLAGATLAIREINTGFQRETTSTANGSFSFAQLPPGNYEIKAQAKGFKTSATQLDLRLGTTQQIRLALAVGEITDSVNVTATANDYRTESSTNIEQQRIDSLPINRRNFLDFALTAPRVTPDRLNLSGTTGTSGLSFNGQSTRGNSVTIDGFTNTDLVNGGVRSTFSQEAVREFQIVSDGYAAEFGRALGGVVNIVTRSGENELHSTLFLFNRNDRSSARNAFAPTKPPYSQYQFGATLSGPLKKDRAFFFTSFERLSIGNNAAITIRDATIASARRLGFPVNNGNVPFSTGQTALLARTDFQLTPNDHLAVRYNGGFRYDGSFETFGQSKGGLISDTADGAQRLRDNTIAINNDYVKAPLNLINETRFLYARRRQRVTPIDGQNPLVQVFAPEGLAIFGQHPVLPQPREENIYQIVDNVTLARGRHQFKFGGDFAYFDLVSAQSFFRSFSGGGGAFAPLDFARQLGIPGAPFLSGLQAFDPSLRTPEQRAFLTTLATNLPNQIPGFPTLALADLSLPVIYQQGFGDGRGAADARLFSAFAQDDFRVRPNLLIKAGVRYDLARVESLTKNNGNVAPRVAIAFRPWEKLNVRAGYGLFFGSALTGAAQNISTYQRGYRTLALSFPFSVIPFAQPNHRYTPAPQLPAGVAFVPQLALEFTVDPKLRASYTQQANLGFDYALSANTTASASYVSVRGNRLFGPRNINTVIRPVPGNPTAGRLTGRVNPARGDVFEFESAFDSYYHGATLALNRRFSQRVGALVSYTYAKAIDNVGENLIVIGSTAYADPLKPGQERGLSYNDVRHRFVASGLWELSYTKHPLLRDFQLATIVTLESGRPYTVRTNVDLNQNGDPTTDRPLGIGRNTGITPGYANVDMRLTRSITFAERFRVQGFAEAFNLFNRTNVSQVANIFSPDAQGQFTLPPLRDGRHSTPRENYRAAFAPRQLQFGFRLSF